MYTRTLDFGAIGYRTVIMEDPVCLCLLENKIFARALKTNLIVIHPHA